LNTGSNFEFIDQNNGMPYLRMFIDNQQVEEVYISEMVLQTVLGNHSIAEEKQRIIDKHQALITQSGKQPSFTIDSIPSKINFFTPLNKKDD
jgi:hypothetical protein